MRVEAVYLIMIGCKDRYLKWEKSVNNYYKDHWNIRGLIVMRNFGWKRWNQANGHRVFIFNIFVRYSGVGTGLVFVRGNIVRILN